MRCPVLVVFRDGAVVAETDHHRDAVFGGGYQKPLKASGKGVVLLLEYGIFEDDPDGVIADGSRKSEFPVDGFQMRFKVQCLPHGDPVAAVGGQIVAATEPWSAVVPFPCPFRTPAC